MASSVNGSSRSSKNFAAALVVGLGTIAAVVLIIYAIARPEGRGWAFWAGLSALAVVGLVTIVSGVARRSRG